MSEKVHKIGVVLRPSTPSLREVYLRLKEVANNNGIEINIDNISGGMCGIYGMEFSKLCEWCDILVSLGGDGTLISTIRRAFSCKKPILGINTGRLGFLTAISLEELEIFMKSISNGDYILRNQMLLSGEIISSQTSKKLHCVNEFLIAKEHISGMITIIATINGKYFNTYLSDGLIIGTPAGSTAYNISAGGAVVYPYSKNILLTPICAHSLTQRPLVLSDEFVLEFELQESHANIIIDGQEIYNFAKGDSLKVQCSRESALLIYGKDYDYFDVLRKKFNWGM